MLSRWIIRLSFLLTALSTLSACGYNDIQGADETTKSAWSEVLNQYQRRADLMRLADDAWQVSLLQATLLHRACAICRQAQIRSLRNVAQLYLIALRAKWEAGSFVGSSVAIKRIVIAERRRPGVLLRETLKLAGVALKGLIHPVT